MTTTQARSSTWHGEPAARGHVNGEIVDLAAWVQQSFRTLARRSPDYAGVLANRSGVRLAGQVVVGDIADVTEQGRDALFNALDLVCRALDIEQGLDTNEFMDRLVRRRSCLDGSRESGTPPH